MFSCTACKAKDDEIKHLRSLVDSILIGKGLAPVVTPVSGPQAAEPAEGTSVADEVTAADIISYGGDAQ